MFVCGTVVISVSRCVNPRNNLWSPFPTPMLNWLRIGTSVVPIATVGFTFAVLDHGVGPGDGSGGFEDNMVCVRGIWLILGACTSKAPRGNLAVVSIPFGVATTYGAPPPDAHAVDAHAPISPVGGGDAAGDRNAGTSVKPGW